MINNIRKRRIELGLTQGELAQLMTVTQGAVAQWENSISMPTVEKLIRLAEILKCPIDDLLRNQDTYNKPNGQGGNA